MCGVLGHLARFHRCVRSLCLVACVVSRASWLLFTGLLVRPVVLRTRCSRPLGSCSPACSLSVLYCVLRVRFSGPLGSCSSVCALGVLCCVCRASLRGAFCSWQGLLPGLCTGSPGSRCFHGSGLRLPWSPVKPGRAWTSSLAVPPLLLARCVGWFAPVHPTDWVWFVVSCPSRRTTCARVCGVHDQLALVHHCARMVCFVCSVCGVLGLLAPVHRCARSVRCVLCAVSRATWLLFTVSSVYGVLGHLTPVGRCASSVRCVACAVSWATGPLFSAVPPRRVVSRLQCPWPLGSC